MVLIVGYNITSHDQCNPQQEWVEYSLDMALDLNRNIPNQLRPTVLVNSQSVDEDYDSDSLGFTDDADYVRAWMDCPAASFPFS